MNNTQMTIISISVEAILKAVDAEIPKNIDALIGGFDMHGWGLITEADEVTLKAIDLAYSIAGIERGETIGAYKVDLGLREGPGVVTTLRGLGANLIDAVSAVGDNNNGEVYRLRALAATNAEMAAMQGIKAHFKRVDFFQRRQEEMAKAVHKATSDENHISSETMRDILDDDMPVDDPVPDTGSDPVEPLSEAVEESDGDDGESDKVHAGDPPSIDSPVNHITGAAAVANADDPVPNTEGQE